SGTPGRRFPVLYLLDGGAAEDFHHVSGLSQLASVNGAMRELIVVGIANTDRQRDMTQPSTVPEEVRDLPTQGGSAAFRAFILRELKPAIEARFATDGRSTLMGESL